MATEKNTYRITSQYFKKRTRSRSVIVALASAFTISVASAFLTPEQFNVAGLWFFVFGVTVGVFALVRNKILGAIFTRINFVKYHDLKSRLVLPFALYMGGLIASLLLISLGSQRLVLGPMAATGAVIVGGFLAIGEVFQENGEASLLLLQSTHQMGLKCATSDSFRWLDSGLDQLASILKKYGMKINTPNLRLGARLSLIDEGAYKDTVEDIARTIPSVEDPHQLRKVIIKVKKL
jgi:hypothetical protein